MTADVKKILRDKRQIAGLTLVELLVAMTLFAILSVGLFGTLRFGTAAWESAADHSEAMNEVLIVQSVLRRHLQQAKPPLPGRRDPDARAIFDGTADRLVFVAPLSNHVGLGGLYRFELTKVRGDKGEALQISWDLYRPNGEEVFVDSERQTERQLVTGAAEIAFRYYGVVEAGRQADWREDWPVDALAPQLIALDITFPDGDPRQWPSLVVAPGRYQSYEALR